MPGGPAGSFTSRTQRTVAVPWSTRTPLAICTSKRTGVPTGCGVRDRMNMPPGLRLVANSSVKLPTDSCLSFTNRPTDLRSEVRRP